MFEPEVLQERAIDFLMSNLWDKEKGGYGLWGVILGSEKMEISDFRMLIFGRNQT